MKRWQNNIPEYLISPLTTGFRKISIGVVKDRNMKELIPIATLLLGWFLSEAAKVSQAQRERKQTISLAISDLLEIWHHIRSTHICFYEIQKKLNLNPKDMAQVKLLVSSILPKEEFIHERFNETVTLIAKEDPLLGFKLRSKDQIIPSLQNLENIADGELDSLAYIKSFDSKLVSVVLPELEKVILTLAWKYKILTFIKLKYKMCKKHELPAELEEIINNIKQSIEQPKPNK
ncbi:hypothetical protein [Endozoicomonas atrinae]|uniref:hypothetical protein n=1 Tax=Endozoicomonas atrinae TaxID=1333660 RepID=UPI003B00C4E5